MCACRSAEPNMSDVSAPPICAHTSHMRKMQCRRMGRVTGCSAVELVASLLSKIVIDFFFNRKQFL